MSRHSTGTRLAAVSAAFLIPLSLAACSSDNSTADSTGSDTGAASAPAETTTEAAPATTDAAATTGAEFGAGCSAVPATGAGSFDGMSTAPVATAASANPALKTLVAALKAAGLVDTLNSGKAWTVFAPADSAFAKLPAGTIDKLLADPKGDLTKILTYHVLPERLAPDQLAGTFKTVNGADLTITGSGEDFKVGDGGSSVVCGNVQTANATVYIIDTVLSPPAA